MKESGAVQKTVLSVIGYIVFAITVLALVVVLGVIIVAVMFADSDDRPSMAVAFWIACTSLLSLASASILWLRKTIRKIRKGPRA